MFGTVSCEDCDLLDTVNKNTRSRGKTQRAKIRAQSAE